MAAPLEDWVRFGGELLEPALVSGAIALLDAEFIVELAEKGERMQPRQLLLPKAFLSLETVMPGAHRPWPCLR